MQQNLLFFCFEGSCFLVIETIESESPISLPSRGGAVVGIQHNSIHDSMRNFIVFQKIMAGCRRTIFWHPESFLLEKKTLKNEDGTLKKN